MSLYTYEKAIPTPPLSDTLKPTNPKRLLHLIPLSISLLGLSLIGFVVWPILSYEFHTDQNIYTTSGLLNPQVNANTTAFAAAPQIVDSADFTQASNWFPSAASPLAKTQSTSYLISIPKLRINKANVNTDTMDLSKSLIQYPGTALPGELGSPVIFGHSILPQFYNPTNYMSIFSLLPSLEPGDLIYTNFDNITYTYEVVEKKEAYPSDLTPLQQQYDDRRLKLVTCVPPGLKTRRLIVTAKLIKT